MPVRPTGIAKSLAIGNPADGVYALGVARRTGGSIEAASDEEIVDGHPAARPHDRHLHRDRRRRHHRRAAQVWRSGARSAPGETVVAYITGDGLKTVEAVAPAVATIAIPADADAVDEALAQPLRA